MLYPKSDLHNHAGRWGNIKYLSEYLGKTIALPPLLIDCGFTGVLPAIELT
jgi:hypothetical protein